MKKLLVITFLLLVPLPVWSQPPEINPDQIINLVFSSNVWGEIDPCG